MRCSPRRLAAAIASLGIATVAIGCASEPELEFADWLFPVPEGTPIREYGAVPLEGRDKQKIQLIEDLVIGDDPSGSVPVLYQPLGIAASEDGNIFIGDRGANDIKMFDADGTYLKTLGREGQGPGEFSNIADMTVAGEHLVVNDFRNRRLSVWTLDGDHVADHATANRAFFSSIWGLGDDTIVTMSSEDDADGTERGVVTLRTFAGEEISRVFETDSVTPDRTSAAGRSDMASMFLYSILSSFDEPRLDLGVGTKETLYMTPEYEYQVLAMSPSGEMLWALRVAWERLPWPDAGKQALIDDLLESFRTEDPPSPDDFDWPTRLPAVARVLTDGLNRVYVFPEIRAPGMDPPEEWPVDVYSPDGEFIAAGVVPHQWSYALGEYVYGVRSNEVEESEVVRYRIVIDEG